jgi:hypothetical protein
MSVRRSSLVRKEVRSGKLHLVIDFRFRDREGRRRRYRKDPRCKPQRAPERRRSGSNARAHDGNVEASVAAPTFATFVEETFTPVFMPRFRPSTRVRYAVLLKQGVLDTFGGQRIDSVGGAIRAYVAKLQARGIQPRGPVNFVRTVLRAAVDAGALAEIPSSRRSRARGARSPTRRATRKCARCSRTRAAGFGPWAPDASWSDGLFRRAR